MRRETERRGRGGWRDRVGRETERERRGADWRERERKEIRKEMNWKIR